MLQEFFDTPSTGNTAIFNGRYGSHRVENGQLVLRYPSLQESRPSGIECILPDISEGSPPPAERLIDLHFSAGGTEMSNSIFIAYAVGPGPGLSLPALPSRASLNDRTGYIIRLIRHGDGTNEVKFYRNDTGWARELQSDSTLPSNPVSSLRRLTILHGSQGDHLITLNFDTGAAFERSYRFEDDAYPPNSVQRRLHLAAKGHAASATILQIQTDSWIVQDNPTAARPTRKPQQKKILRRKIVDDEAWHLTGQIEQSLGNLFAAQAAFSSAVAIRKSRFGPEDQKVADSLEMLAGIYGSKDPEMAERLYLEALDIRTKGLGPSHPGLFDVLTGLAALYQANGQDSDAISLYLRSLEIGGKKYGPGHPVRADLVLKLGRIYKEKKQFEKAESLYKEGLAIRQKLLGPDHEEVMAALHLLEWLYVAMDQDIVKKNDAETIYLRSLDLREKLWGSSHPDLALTLNNLATLYFYQGRYRDALPLYERILHLREKTMDTRHPAFAGVLNNLAAVYSGLEIYDQAEPLYRRSLIITQDALGDDHLDVGRSLYDLGLIQERQGRFVEAESSYRRALSIFDKRLGAGHPHIESLLGSIEQLCRRMGRPKDAARYAERLRKIRTPKR